MLFLNMLSSVQGSCMGRCWTKYTFGQNVKVVGLEVVEVKVRFLGLVPAGEHPTSTSSLCVHNLSHKRAVLTYPLGDFKMHGANFFWQDRQHDASKYTVSPLKLILAVCARAFVQGREAVLRYCRPGSLLAKKLVRAGVVTKGAEKSVLELSISSTYRVLWAPNNVSFCTLLTPDDPKRRFMMYKEPLH